MIASASVVEMQKKIAMEYAMDQLLKMSAVYATEVELQREPVAVMEITQSQTMTAMATV